MIKLIIAMLIGVALVVLIGSIQSHFTRGPQNCHYVGTSGDGWREYNCKGETVFSR